MMDHESNGHAQTCLERLHSPHLVGYRPYPSVQSLGKRSWYCWGGLEMALKSVQRLSIKSDSKRRLCRIRRRYSSTNPFRTSYFDHGFTTFKGHGRQAKLIRNGAGFVSVGNGHWNWGASRSLSQKSRQLLLAELQRMLNFESVSLSLMV